MIIIAGTFKVAPEQRELFIERRKDAMIRSRGEHGNLAYAFMADPLDDGIVRLFECWENQEDLDAHAAAARLGRTTEPPPEPVIEVIEREVLVYPIAAPGPRPL
jgi:quinol monooxygenase YgiN